MLLLPPWRRRDPPPGPAHPSLADIPGGVQPPLEVPGYEARGEGGSVTHSRLEVGEGRVLALLRKRAACGASRSSQSPRSCDVEF